MSFFVEDKPRRLGSVRKRKPGKAVLNKDVKRLHRTNKQKQQDDDVTSEESDAELGVNLRKKDIDEYSSSDDDETADQKRKRLAQEHLEKLKAYVASDDEDDDIDAIGQRLKDENLAKRGRLHRDIASQYVEPSAEDVTVCRGHHLPVTCVVITSDMQYIFSGSKDCTIIKWSVATGKKLHVIPRGPKGSEKQPTGHTSHVLCLAISSDGKYLASGDRSRLIHIWNAETCQLLHSSLTRQHRDAISGLAFRHGTHDLYSVSFDRTVKVWNVSETGIFYVETLFGHQDKITGIDVLSQERVVTSGARDGSVRIWKIVEESQLVFHGHSGSIDCVCYIDDSHFFSGADDGSVALWGTLKKKPLFTLANAHLGQMDAANSADSMCSESVSDEDVEPDDIRSEMSVNGLQPSTAMSCSNSVDFLAMQKDNWVTSVAALHNTDLVVSGSKDGFLRFWKCGQDYRSLTPLFALPMVGFVNSLQFSADGSLLVAGIGTEHRFGRWWHLKSAKNCVCIVRLKKLSTSKKLSMPL